MQTIDLINAIEQGDSNKIKEVTECLLNSRKAEYLQIFKEEFADDLLYLDEEDLTDEELEELEERSKARFFKVNRVRKGKVQRRKVVTGKDNMKVVGGKVTRMSAKERKNRSLAQRKAARKRRATVKQALRKRKKSLRLRKSRGL
jgi:hypothetical protein